jgi:hypothetical protein
VWFVQYLYNFAGQASPTVPTAPRWAEAPELDSRVDLALTAKERVDADFLAAVGG